MSQESQTSPATRAAASVTGWAISTFARLLTAVQPDWRGMDPGEDRQRVFYANHVSHGDSVLIWTVLPPRLRRRVRPVAGADYWRGDPVRRFVGAQVFNSLLIDRNPRETGSDPVGQMADALREGASLIVFPEGTRNLGEEPLLPFKSGIARLAEARPEVDLVPVWIENLNRVLPKGAVIPVPLMCKVIFGSPVQRAAGEQQQAFLTRARDALLALKPMAEGA